MNKPIEYRDLGDVAAERDGNLISYFVEEVPSFVSAKDFSNKRFIILGRTGAGKSAIIQSLKAFCDANDDYAYAYIQHSKGDMDFIVKSAREEVGNIDPTVEVILYKLAWYYVISIGLIIARFSKDRGGKRELHIDRDIDRDVYDFIKNITDAHVSSILDKRVGDVFIDVIRTVKIKGEVEGGLGFLKGKMAVEKDDATIPVKSVNDMLKLTQDFVENGLRKMMGGKKFYILIDDLDIGWDPKSDIQQRLVSTLFDAMSKISYIDGLKAVIALRVDIFRTLKVHQREKYPDLMIRVGWDNLLLRTFILKRFQVIYDMGELHLDSVYSKFFEGVVAKGDVLNYMISMTLQRPRDLLELSKKALAEAARSGDERIAPQHVEVALSDYSLGRIIALNDEWQHMYSDLEDFIERFYVFARKHDFLNERGEFSDLRGFKDCFVSFGASDGVLDNFEWFKNIYDGSGLDPQKFLALLYDIGFIFIKRGVGVFSVQEDEQMPQLEKGMKVVIQPVYHHYLFKSFGGEDPFS